MTSYTCRNGAACIHPEGPALPLAAFYLRSDGKPRPLCKRCTIAKNGAQARRRGNYRAMRVEINFTKATVTLREGKTVLQCVNFADLKTVTKYGDRELKRLCGVYEAAGYKTVKDERGCLVLAQMG